LNEYYAHGVIITPKALANTPKALANFSPGLERQRQPWGSEFNIKIKPWKAGARTLGLGLAYAFGVNGLRLANTFRVKLVAIEPMHMGGPKPHGKSR